MNTNAHHTFFFSFNNYVDLLRIHTLFKKSAKQKTTNQTERKERMTDSPYERHPEVVHGMKGSKLSLFVPPLVGQQLEPLHLTGVHSGVDG